MDLTEGTVTLPLMDYDELNRASQDQDPMTRQERIDGTVHALVVCGGIGAIFVGTTAAYYWIRDRYERRSLDRKFGPQVVPETHNK